MVVQILHKAELSSDTVPDHQLCGITSLVSAIERRRLQKLEDTKKRRERKRLSAPELVFENHSPVDLQRPFLLFCSLSFLTFPQDCFSPHQTLVLQDFFTKVWELVLPS